MSALQVLSAMRHQAKTLAELTAELDLMPQVLVNNRLPMGYEWKEDRPFMENVEQARLALEGRGRVLIRPSGTEPLLRIMVECNDADLAKQLANKMADALSV